MDMIALRPLVLLAPLLIVACVGGRNIQAPSLTQRDYERESVPVPDPEREPASTLDPALTTKIQKLLDQADAAHATFARAQAKAEIAIDRAAKAPAGSESWTAAQQELSALDAGRGPLQGIETEVDGLRADPANATPANRAAIETAQQKVQAIAGQESATIRALSDRLNP